MRVLAEDNEKKIKAAENEALLASKEQEQLRSIMGNVAHDLKTPLHSIMAEIEHLKELINAGNHPVKSNRTHTITQSNLTASIQLLSLI